MGVGVVTFPTCLIVIAPCLWLIPREFWLWQPRFACLAAAVVSPFAMYLWAVAFEHPRFDNVAYYVYAAAAMVAGVTFAFFYSRRFLLQKNRPSAPVHAPPA